MASSKDLVPNREDKLAERRAAEQDVLLREVDEAVRHDQVGHAVRRYGVPVGIGLVLALLAFGGWLLWSERQDGQREERSEQLITAFDALEAGRTAEATPQLTALAEEDGASAAAARLSLAAIALRANRPADAIKQFEAVAGDAEAPRPYRDLAQVRLVAARFDQMKPEDVIARLKPLATPGTPWFGSAGELVAMAYLKQGKEELAGPLLAAVAKDDTVPQSLRSRTRQLAGLLGYDAVVDVDETLTQLQQERAAPGAAAPAGTPAAPAAAPADGAAQ